jgi:hypothetical protein
LWSCELWHHAGGYHHFRGIYCCHLEVEDMGWRWKMEVIYFLEALEPPKRLHGVTVQKIQKSQLYVVFALHGNRWLYFNICKVHSSYTSAHKGDCSVRLCFFCCLFLLPCWYGERVLVWKWVI